ncbi:hypothetical protein [Paenibacillus sp. Soil787]|uniref:hypothetical protein n=1 Tax=Paenibacillus sp. Soil787 TaxID=1736411 RepID=UPI000A464A4C|nr:hypothetical protein [Paenibacillus sp. Soil787]
MTLPMEQLDHVYIVQLSGVCVKNFQYVMCEEGLAVEKIFLYTTCVNVIKS